MYLVNESGKLEPVNKVYETREKAQSLLDHPRIHTINSNSNIIIFFTLLILFSIAKL